MWLNEREERRNRESGFMREGGAEAGSNCY